MSLQLVLPCLPPIAHPPLKRCAWCFEVKIIGEFSRDRSRPDGFAQHCRRCGSDRSKQLRHEGGDLPRVRERRRYSADPDRQRKAAAEYRRSDRGKKLNKLAVQRYRERNREKYSAHIEVRKAIASGILSKPQTCELAHLDGCDGRVEYHHPDYSKPLEVRALCLHHHNGVHLKPNVTPAPLLDYRPALGSR